MKVFFGKSWLPALLLSLVACFALTSCSDESKIIGRWECDEDAYGRDIDGKIVMEFNDDGTGFFRYPGEHKFDFEYTLKDNGKLTLNEPNGDKHKDLRYKFKENDELVIYDFDGDDLSELHFEKED